MVIINMIEKFNKLISDTKMELIGEGTFEIGKKYDIYFDNLFLGLSLQNNLLYVYYENCPGRHNFVYKWPGSKKDFDDFIAIIEKLENISNIVQLAFHFSTLKGK